MEKRANKEQKASEVTDSIIDIPGKPERPRMPSSYEFLKKKNPEHRLVKKYDAELKVFNDYWDSVYVKPEQPKPEPKKKLVEVDIKSAYKLFKQKYFEVTGDAFDHEANDGEGKKLAYTLLYYFFRRDKNFLNSPLINTDVNELNIDKGILVIGDYGCGKTSIFKAVRKMFFDAASDPEIMIKDVDGDMVSLIRYRRMFGYYTANEVVRMYEECTTPEQKDRFWKVITKGQIYFDDLMTERQASNYGKVEIFKDILEERYDKGLRTLASCNYTGEGITVESTMKELGKRYGNRVYDRLFHMFNIVELKGKSLRK